MGLKSAIAAVLAVLPIAAVAATPAGVVIDRKVFVPDARVNAELMRIADTHQFDAAAARGLVQVIVSGGVTPNEIDLLYELVAARVPITVSITTRNYFLLPPPSPEAREYLNLLKLVLDTSDFLPVLDARWLAGARQTKEIVDIASLGPEANSKVVNYILRKLTDAWMNSNAANGYAPFKDDVAKLLTQLGQNDPDTARRGRALVFNIARDVDRRADNAIPDELYASLRP